MPGGAPPRGREDLQPGRRSGVRFRTPHGGVPHRRDALPQQPARGGRRGRDARHEPPKVEGVQHEHARGHRGPPLPRHHRRRAPGPPEARRRGGEARHRLRPRDARRAARDGYRAERARRRRHDRGRDGRSSVWWRFPRTRRSVRSARQVGARREGLVASERTPARAGSSGAAYASDGDAKKTYRKNQNQNASRPRRRRRARLPEPPRGVRDPRAQGTFGGDGVLRRWHAAGDRVRAGHGRARARPARRRESDRRTFRRGVSSAVVRQLAFGAAPGGGLGLAASSEKGTVHVFELSASASPSEADAGHDAGRSDPTHTESRPSVDVEARPASSWRAVGASAARRRRRRNWRAPSPRDWRASRSGATSRGARRTRWTLSARWRPFAFPPFPRDAKRRARKPPRGGAFGRRRGAVRGARAASTSETPQRARAARRATSSTRSASSP